MCVRMCECMWVGLCVPVFVCVCMFVCARVCVRACVYAYVRIRMSYVATSEESLSTTKFPSVHLACFSQRLTPNRYSTSSLLQIVNTSTAIILVSLLYVPLFWLICSFCKQPLHRLIHLRLLLCSQCH